MRRPLAVAWVLQIVQETSFDLKGSISSLEQESIDYFVSLVGIFGFPKSVGQIYGLLFVARDPMALDDVVERLGMSKGSVSQGLAMLRQVGVVVSQPKEGDRREHFVADLQVSRIAAHFFDNQLVPQLEVGSQRLERMASMASEMDAGDGVEGEPVYNIVQRVEALSKWHRRGEKYVPRILRFLRGSKSKVS